MLGAGFAAGSPRASVAVARGRSLVGREGQKVLRHADSDAKPSAIETQEGHTHAFAKPERLAQSQNQAQGEQFAHTDPGGRGDAPSEAQEILALADAKPDGNSQPLAGRIPFTQPGWQSLDRFT